MDCSPPGSSVPGILQARILEWAYMCVCVCVCVCTCAHMLSHVRLFSTHACGWQPTRLLCPWNSSGKKIWADCHFLLQGIFPTQESNPTSLLSPALAGRFFTSWATREAQWDPHLKDFYRLRPGFTVALLRFHVLQACCKHNLKTRGGNLSSYSRPAATLRKPPGLSGRTSLSILITGTDHSHGCLVSNSWPRFCLQIAAHSFLTTRWEENMPPHPSFLPYKMYEFCSYVKIKRCLRLSEWDISSPISIYIASFKGVEKHSSRSS